MLGTLNASLKIVVLALVLVLPGRTADAQQRLPTEPGGTPAPAIPAPSLPRPAPGTPGSGVGAPSLQPSIVAPSPAPQLRPPVAAVPAAPAARAATGRQPRAWCIVRPGDPSCRGAGPPDGGGDAADNECRCGRDRCEQRLQPNGGFQLVCFK